MQLSVATAPESSSLPADCYISVRVGELQKQTAYDPRKLFRFPEARNSGKIDVLQRIGSCDIAWDAGDPEKQQCKVLDERSMSDTGVQLLVSVTKTGGGPAYSEGGDQILHGKHLKKRELSNKAQQYLERHRVEQILVAALRALLKKMPEDAAEFLCSYIMANYRVPAAEEQPAESRGDDQSPVDKELLEQLEQARGDESAVVKQEQPEGSREDDQSKVDKEQREQARGDESALVKQEQLEQEQPEGSREDDQSKVDKELREQARGDESALVKQEQLEEEKGASPADHVEAARPVHVAPPFTAYYGEHLLREVRPSHSHFTSTNSASSSSDQYPADTGAMAAASAVAVDAASDKKEEEVPKAEEGTHEHAAPSASQEAEREALVGASPAAMGPLERAWWSKPSVCTWLVQSAVSDEDDDGSEMAHMPSNVEDLERPLSREEALNPGSVSLSALDWRNGPDRSTGFFDMMEALPTDLAPPTAQELEEQERFQQELSMKVVVSEVADAGGSRSVQPSSRQVSVGDAGGSQAVQPSSRQVSGAASNYDDAVVVDDDVVAHDAQVEAQLRALLEAFPKSSSRQISGQSARQEQERQQQQLQREPHMEARRQARQRRREGAMRQARELIAQGKREEAKQFLEAENAALHEEELEDARSMSKKFTGKLKVHVLGAKHLRGADITGRSDPYCLGQICGKPETEFKTNHLMKNLEPFWDETFEVPGFIEGDNLLFTVWDYDKYTEDDFLGAATLKWEDFLSPKGFQGELQLLDKSGHSTPATLRVAVTVPALMHQASSTDRAGS